LIRLRLLLPVNPKTVTQNLIGAILWLDENLAGLLLIEPKRLGKEECTDMNIVGIKPLIAAIAA